MLTGANQSAALLAAIKEYETNKWKAIGQKVGKPAKVRRKLLARSSSRNGSKMKLTLATRPASSTPRSISGGRCSRVAVGVFPH